MKQRFSALDVRATVSDLKERIIGLRLQNFYDISPKTYLLKFAKPDKKEFLLVESGNRIHTTQFTRDKSISPSTFCIKIRKHIRARKLTNVRQLGIDRIIDFEFGSFGEGTTYHLITEFYAAGNIILTDGSYTILALLRVVQPKENQRMAVGHIYDISSVARDAEAITISRLQSVLKNASPKDTLKKALIYGLNYGQSLTEHAILIAQLDPTRKIADITDFSDDSDLMKALLNGFQEADRIISESANRPQKGYIIYRKHKENVEADDNEKKKEPLTTYDEFHPFLFEQHKSKPFKEFDSYDAAVDEYFSSLESQRLDLKQRAQEELAMNKLETIRQEQFGRVQGLERSQLENVRKAKVIEQNIDIVDQALLVIRQAIASSMDWKDLENLVKEERNKGNPIANIITGLKLGSNQITLLLGEPEEDTYQDSDEEIDEEDSKQAASEVDVDIYLSAFANARRYYNVMKQSAAKQEKTLLAADKAFKSAEKKIQHDLRETRITASITQIRKTFWFEKFWWFISSENYLVIAGRDMQQNELIVKRHLRKGEFGHLIFTRCSDVYVHADLHGAASVIIKNSHEGQPIPPSTLYQAGVMSVCMSKAWDAKIVTSAYWVHAEQVSKTAPTGEYLTTGSFMIRGKKNFLPPVQLAYGFGVMFRLDEQSYANHLHERRPMIADDDDEEREMGNNELSQNAAEIENKDENNREIDDGEDNLSILDDDTISQETETSVQPVDNETKPNTELADHTSTELKSRRDSESNVGSSLVGTWEKYSLDEYGDDLDERERTEQPRTRKQYITAKERRMMKKQKNRPISEDATATIIADLVDDPSQNKGRKAIQETKQSTPPQPPVRGKKGRLRKMRERYADQDEEERQLRMELLGSNRGPQSRGRKERKDAERKATSQTGKDSARKGPKHEQTGETSENTLENQAAVEELQEAEEVRQLFKDENITFLEGSEADNLTILDTLTGTPFADDILQFAVPVCAPYAALQKYKYKVKLLPGTMKKGKACKVATNFFLHVPDITPREKELIKSIPDEEVMLVLLGKCKVTAPNIEKSKMLARKTARSNTLDTGIKDLK
ncbi:10624_t:CDS:10 [Paraglomus brasilianum]|uniref:10624_t:CDS:1 n=1 Tax=Paraglomus brasilianum TaxID=144538 RepID=A0A9N9AP34_9GLOM|nr:10624_t:CDS:10 [Paraglomus brasilianum]